MHLFYMCFTECGTNHTVAHSQANFTERTQFHYGTVVPIYCDKGYKIDGNNFAVCQEDGTWSKTRCRKKGTVKHINQCIRFPTMWYVRPTKPQNRLRKRAA